MFVACLLGFLFSWVRYFFLCFDVLYLIFLRILVGKILCDDLLLLLILLLFHLFHLYIIFFIFCIVLVQGREAEPVWGVLFMCLNFIMSIFGFHRGLRYIIMIVWKYIWILFFIGINCCTICIGLMEFCGICVIFGCKHLEMIFLFFNSFSIYQCYWNIELRNSGFVKGSFDAP